MTKYLIVTGKYMNVLEIRSRNLTCKCTREAVSVQFQNRRDDLISAKDTLSYPIKLIQSFTL